MIGERPSETADRAVPGHWEGDLIRGAGNGSAIGTLVERAIKFAILPYLSDGHDAVRVRDAIIRKISGLPGIPGTAPRGTNENTNGPLRRYFPEGADPDVFSEDHLDAPTEKLNDRPRKTLGYRKSNEAMMELGKYPMKSKPDALDVHDAVADAIAKGDPERACKAMFGIVDEVARVLNFLKNRNSMGDWC